MQIQCLASSKFSWKFPRLIVYMCIWILYFYSEINLAAKYFRNLIAWNILMQNLGVLPYSRFRSKYSYMYCQLLIHLIPLMVQILIFYIQKKRGVHKTTSVCNTMSSDRLQAYCFSANHFTGEDVCTLILLPWVWK